jgi:hypothetical protein
MAIYHRDISERALRAPASWLDNKRNVQEETPAPIVALANGRTAENR